MRIAWTAPSGLANFGSGAVMPGRGANGLATIMAAPYVDEIGGTASSGGIYAEPLTTTRSSAACIQAG